MSARAQERDEDAGGTLSAYGLSLGILAMLPLFLAYEWGVFAGGEAGPRNTSELLATRILRASAAPEELVRWIVLAAAGVGALVVVARRGQSPVAGIVRQLLEGVLFAVLLGPLVLVLLSVFELSPGALVLPEGPPEAPLAAGSVARLLGAAAWEELVFRVGIYSACYLLVRRAAAALGVAADHDAVLGDLVALVVSSLAFAAFHVEAWTGWLVGGGEPFRSAVFAWRVACGLLLALVFRWRGVGVAAWAHGLFNVGLVLGAGPGVFL